MSLLTNSFRMQLEAKARIAQHDHSGEARSRGETSTECVARNLNVAQVAEGTLLLLAENAELRKRLLVLSEGVVDLLTDAYGVR